MGFFPEREGGGVPQIFIKSLTSFLKFWGELPGKLNEFETHK